MFAFLLVARGRLLRLVWGFLEHLRRRFSHRRDDAILTTGPVCHRAKNPCTLDSSFAY